MALGISGILLILCVIAGFLSVRYGVPWIQDKILARKLRQERLRQEQIKTETMERRMIDETLDRERQRDRQRRKESV